MNPDEFKSDAPGSLVKTDKGNWAFLPEALPPDILWDDRLVNSLVAANSSIARLAQSASDIDSTYLVSRISDVFANMEARFSSGIEGIHTTSTELFLFQDEPDETQRQTHTQETHNYLEALYLGLRRVRDPNDIPICNRLMLDLHRVLLNGVRGADKHPGMFRKVQNLIGEKGNTELTAKYVPPPPNLMLEAMGELETYINMRSDLDPLIRAALVHYQFEALHPFLDGNGRIGRLLIVLMLCEAGSMQHPLLYPSGYLEVHRQEYYERLQRVSTHGEWHEWLAFFLRGIEVQATEALTRFGRLQSIHKMYVERYRTTRSSAMLLSVIDELFSNPIASVKRIAAKLSLKYDTVNRYFKILGDDGVLVPMGSRRRNRRFVAIEILQAIEAD